MFRKICSLLLAVILLSFVFAGCGKQKPVAGFTSESGGIYYRDSNGDTLSGWAEVGGVKYWFATDGRAAVGWKELDGSLYHFGQDGSLTVNTTLEGFTIGQDGKATMPSSQGDEEPSEILTGIAELDNKIGEILDSLTDGNDGDVATTDKLYDAYHWIIRNMRYKYITVDDSAGYTPDLTYELAAHSAKYYNGSCEHFAAMMYVFCQRLGYDAVMVNGEFLDDDRVSWVAHVWVIANIDGRYRHFDPLYGRNHTDDSDSFFMKKDSEIETLHRWDRDKYPVCD